jgi:hydrogenase maturation protein HypF
MIGGDLAVKEPARMLISILSKFLPKEKIYTLIQDVSSSHGRRNRTHSKKIYTRNQFELLYNQLQSGFNCQETSSTGRVLDTVSILLGFCQNERNFKHEPTILLEQNSTIPYENLKPKIKKSASLPLWKRGLGGFSAKGGSACGGENTYELDTTYLFKYLFKYLHRDKKRLAATAQLYIAEGLYKIILKSEIRNPKQIQNSNSKIQKIFLSGGISNNKIISKGAIANNVIPRGDAGISFGQIIYHLTNSRY